MAISNFDREDLHAPTAEINTTPLVDVMLVLMVIFLVTAPVLEKAIVLDLPKEAAPSAIDAESITISVTKDSRYYINADEISAAELQSRLAMLKKNKPSAQIAIRADASARYENVMRVLSYTSNAGFINIAFINSESK